MGGVVSLAGGVGSAQQPPAPGAPAAGAPAAPQRQESHATRKGRGGRGGGPPVNARALGDGPWEYGAGAARYRVTVVTKGVVNPWGIAFLPDGDLLVTERPGRLRVIRKGVLDPTPIGPLPDMLAEGLGGMMDVSLHPQFAQNRLIYFTYSKLTRTRSSVLGDDGRARARWDGGSTLADVKDIIVTNGWHGGPGSPAGIGPATGSYGSRLAWDTAGMLYVTTGDRNYVQSRRTQ